MEKEFFEMTVDTLLELTPQDTRTLISVLNELPNSISNYVKMHLVKFLGIGRYPRKISLYKDDPLVKFIPKDMQEDTSKPSVSIMSDYCNIMYLLEKDPSILNMKKEFPTRFNDLQRLMDTKSFDKEGLAKVERLAWGSLMIVRNTAEIADIISHEIIPYKAKACDFYSYVLLGKELGMGSEYFTNMTDINKAITYLMYRIESPSSANYYQMDYAALIYLYLVELGFTDQDLRNQGVAMLNRFICSTNYAKNKEYEGQILDFAESLKEEVLLLYENNSDINDVMDMISIKGELGLLFKNKKYDFNNEGSQFGNYIVVGRNQEPFGVDVLEKIPMLIANDGEGILQMTLGENSNSTWKDCLKLYLLPDDIGHLLNNEELAIEMVFDTVRKEMYYVCSYNDATYLMYKLVSKPKIIYGISILPNESGNYNILQIKKSPMVEYVHNDRVLNNI